MIKYLFILRLFCVLLLGLNLSNVWAQQPGTITLEPVQCIEASPVVVGLTPAGGELSGPGVTQGSMGEWKFSPNQAGAGVHTLIYTYVDSVGMTGTAIQTVEVIKKTPTPQIISNSPVCAGQTLCLTAVNVLPGTYFSWVGPGGFSSTINPTCIANANSSSSGIYSIMATKGGCEPSNSATFNAQVHPVPNPPIIGVNSNPACAGSNLNFNTISMPGATYSWSGPNGYVSSMQNSTISNVQTHHAGIYTVTVTVNGCSASSTVNISVTDIGTVNLINPDGVYCSDGSTTDITLSPNYQNYNAMGPGVFAAFIGFMFDPGLAGPGTHTIKIQGSEQGCPFSVLKTVVVSEPIQVIPTLSGASCPTCADGSIALNISGGTPPYVINMNGVPFTQTTFTGLTAGEYSFTIVDANGCTTQAVYTLSVIECGTPTQLSAQNMIPGTVLFNWNNVPGALGYTLQYRKLGSTSWLTLNVATNYRQINDLSVNAIYEARVRAKCITSGFSAYSPIITVEVLPSQTACNPPTNLSTSPLSPQSILVKWQPSPGASSYKLQYRRTLDGMWSTLYTTTGTTYEFGNLLPGTLYSVRVRALCLNNAVTSLWSLASGVTPAGRLGALSENDNQSIQTVELYPNPTRGMLNIRLSNLPAEPLPIIIMDLTGRILFTTELLADETQLDLSNFAKGVYCLKIGFHNTKIVVE